MKKATMKKGLGYTDSGRAYKLATRKAIALTACTGEAHSNAYIDHCGTCMNHRWGWMAVYESCDVPALTATGLAVPVSFDEVEREERRDRHEEYLAAGIAMVHVTQRLVGGSVCSFYAYVKGGE